MKAEMILPEPEKLPIRVGWREWIGLPELKIKRIKAKIDTGARSSALHTFYLETYHCQGEERVRFFLHPFQRNTKKIIECDAKVIDKRWVSDSGGHREKRSVILTSFCLGSYCWPIEVTLTNRDTMRFRMLVGRTALSQVCHIVPHQSYLCGKRKDNA